MPWRYGSLDKLGNQEFADSHLFSTITALKRAESRQGWAQRQCIQVFNLVLDQTNSEKKQVNKLSKGEKRMLEIALLKQARPKQRLAEAKQITV